MKYYNSDFLAENLRLRSTPNNSMEAYNKLACLMECEERRNPDANRFYVYKMSKRRRRIDKMFWAFRRMEAV